MYDLVLGKVICKNRLCCGARKFQALSNRVRGAGTCLGCSYQGMERSFKSGDKIIFLRLELYQM
jgi:hypothetical protein